VRGVCGVCGFGWRSSVVSGVVRVVPGGRGGGRASSDGGHGGGTDYGGGAEAKWLHWSLSHDHGNLVGPRRGVNRWGSRMRITLCPNRETCPILGKWFSTGFDPNAPGESGDRRRRADRRRVVDRRTRCRARLSILAVPELKAVKNRLHINLRVSAESPAEEK
jgi:hypothetical protein